MGSGIAQLTAVNGCKTIIYDPFDSSLVKSEAGLKKILKRLEEKGKIKYGDSEKILNRITFTTDINNLSQCKFIFEAAPESIDIKKNLVKKISEITSEDTVIATNTSSLSVTSIAAASDKGNIAGAHFFNPAPLMKLVEIIPALQTKENVLKELQDFVNSLGKITVITKDTPGFIVNKVARPFYGEALRIYDENIAGIQEIDSVMRDRGGFRMGPFELMDLIGNDVNYSVTETVFREFYFDPRYKPSFTQKRYVEAGRLGKKSGQGFYDYTSDVIPDKIFPDEKLADDIFLRIIAMLINEAADTLHMGIASMEDIDTAVKSGVNYPKGLFEWADEIGLDKILDTLRFLRGRYGEERYRISPLLTDFHNNRWKFYEKR